MAYRSDDKPSPVTGDTPRDVIRDESGAKVPFPKPRPQPPAARPAPAARPLLNPRPPLTKRPSPASGDDGSVTREVPAWAPDPSRKPTPKRVVEDKPADILSAWTALEVLSPTTYLYPKALADDDEKRIANFKMREPWAGDGEGYLLNGRQKTKLFYQVILGAIRMDSATKSLLTAFEDKNADRQEAKGFAPIAAITIDAQGVPQEELPIAISSFAWGLPKALDRDLSSLGGWQKAERELVSELGERLRIQNDDLEVMPLTFAAIADAFDWLVDKLGLHPSHVVRPSFAVRVFHFEFSKEPPEPPLLGSFYLTHLAEAAELEAAGKLPKALKHYLGVIAPPEREDVLKDDQLLASTLSPILMPKGRWPAKGRHPLVLLQQAAVNLAVNQASKSGILPVNGPPGTGKTTLLRDAVAGLVVDRAKAMCEFDDPAKAFTTGTFHKSGQSRLTVSQLAPSLRGFEMLVASTNNAAVENVSRELPSLKAVAADAPGMRYFKTVSDHVAGDESTWGLIAAVMGKSSNRRAFRQRAWIDKDHGLRSYLAEASGVRQLIDEPADPQTGEVRKRRPKIVLQEDPPSDHTEALRRWRVARDRFVSAYSEVAGLLMKLEEGRRGLGKFAELQQPLQEADAVVAAAQVKHVEAVASIGKCQQQIALHEARLKQVEGAQKLFEQTSPGPLAKLFRTKAFRTWLSESLEYSKQAIAAHNEVLQTVGVQALAAKAAQDAERALKAAKAGYVEIERSVRRAAEQAAGMRAIAGDRIVDTAFFARGRDEIQLDSPWISDELHRKRDEVFELALALHKAFVDAAAKPLRDNLEVLFQTFSSGLAWSEKINPFMPDLWSSLFLVVPVMSTTFASAERMIGHLDAEALGWMLVDEAGQAAPQAAVGALARVQNAIIVGDPQQIEPVNSLPTSLTEAICRDFGIDSDKWSAPASSVQSLADTTSRWGTRFEKDNGSVDVGFPLLVHRRSAEPMFSIANEIAYAGLMVHAVQPRHSDIRSILGPSHWIDVRSSHTMDKWCEAEGEAVVQLLHRLDRAGLDKLDLYIVTPFTVVSKRLRELVLRSGALRRWTEKPAEWVKERIGTVHTVQGREADSVIMVLGAPMPANGGARSWAGGQVNLLNVAVTRAQENFYVVGNRAVWEEAGYFRRLAARVHVPHA
ncbi:DEAD/DEAH box helicase [Bosea sp. ANAM02]|uniref:DEAD/DEAH box helicase family protein n=1 Tax=Bosea sp. ANAM02 TaxID=2020412 RepID=UPI00140EB551|nr:DEAD/DEAH box helicase [Bosea sp. ANAM02]BCB22337.1 hypothetical protein OCUBac02_52310 [Bosea sp. ANAM02]